MTRRSTAMRHPNRRDSKSRQCGRQRRSIILGWVSTSCCMKLCGKPFRLPPHSLNFCKAATKQGRGLGNGTEMHWTDLQRPKRELRKLEASSLQAISCPFEPKPSPCTRTVFRSRGGSLRNQPFRPKVLTRYGPDGVRFESRRLEQGNIASLVGCIWVWELDWNPKARGRRQVTKKLINQVG